ncbi:hypothetical protein P389DRAFT_167152 [Cystobasidium minutum MCA 4210]|uniref:uncharacterized protein n=1 Tax=Cystobasidium minutum MCA 4210 TaxID=1397322 RepID=UPI0034CE1DC5|eukprot:jgi/Rhomi1/167152/fgenesh1_kg.2_\
MSYADIAAKNRLPESQQPHPDPNLLEGSHHSESDTDLSQSGASDEKIHVVSQEEFVKQEHALESPPAPQEPVLLTADDATDSAAVQRKAQADAEKVEANAKKAANETKKAAEDAKDKAEDVKEDAKDKASKAYAQGEKKLEKGKEEASKEYAELSEKAKRAYDRLSEEGKKDWQKLSKESKKKWEEAKNSDAGQELQKPEVWGSLLGLANLAVTGTTIYFAYKNRNKPRWDRRVVSATVIGLAAWFGVQGYLLPQSDAVKQRRR